MKYVVNFAIAVYSQTLRKFSVRYCQNCFFLQVLGKIYSCYCILLLFNDADTQTGRILLFPKVHRKWCNCPHGPERLRICWVPFTFRRWWVVFFSVDRLLWPTQSSLSPMSLYSFPHPLQTPKITQKHALFSCGFQRPLRLCKSITLFSQVSITSKTCVRMRHAFKNSCQVLINADVSSKTFWHVTFNMCVIGLPSLT